MNPELNRSDDRGEELATTEQSAEPAASPETVQHQPADDTGQLTDDSGRSPAESHQAADRERDAADAQAIELAADQTDGALLADAGLRAGWQRIQVGFVDDPREAVADAADLVEHTAQAFVGALQQRQRRLRGIWDGDRRPDGAPEQMTDTEQLRLVMQRYRSLFDQLCRP
jgi:hypothetical protein